MLPFGQTVAVLVTHRGEPGPEKSGQLRVDLRQGFHIPPTFADLPSQAGKIRRGLKASALAAQTGFAVDEAILLLHAEEIL